MNAKVILSPVMITMAVMLHCGADATTLIETEWSADKLLSQVTQVSGATGSFSSASAGNPGPSLKFNYSMSIPANQRSIVAGIATTENLVMLDSFESVAWSIDIFLETPTGANGSAPGAISLGVFQGGKLFLSVPTLPVGEVKDQWRSLSSGPMRSTDFAVFDGSFDTPDPTVHPDFSAGSVAFFLWTPISATNVGPRPVSFTANAYFDNLAVTVSPVPEPSRWLLSAGGLLVIAAMRRHLATRRVAIS